MSDRNEYSVDDILDEIGPSTDLGKSADDSLIDSILGLTPTKENIDESIDDILGTAFVPEKEKVSEKKPDKGKITVKKSEEALPVKVQEKAEDKQPKEAKPVKAHAMVVSPEDLSDTKLIFEDSTPKYEKKKSKEKPKDDGELSFEKHNIEPIGRKDNREKGSPARTNKSLLDSLNKSLNEKRSSEQINDSKLAPEAKKEEFKLSSELKRKVIADTEQMTLEVPIKEEDKIRELKAKRSHKIRDFVLEATEEGKIDDAKISDPNENGEIDDYNSFEDTPSILEDLAQIKSSLMLRFFMLICMGVCALYISVANELSLPIIDYFNKSIHPEGFLYASIILGVLAAFVSYTVISSGTSKALAFKADSDSVSALAMVISLLSAFVLLFDVEAVRAGKVGVYIVVAIFGLIFNTLGKLEIVLRTKRNFRFVSGDSPKHSVAVVENEKQVESFTRGTMNDIPVLATTRKTEFLSDFLANSYSVDYADNLSRRIVPISVVLSLVLAGAVYFLTSNSSLAISAFTAAICVCAPFSIMFIVNVPLSRVSSSLSKESAVMLGYSTVDEFADVNSVLIDATQLFPESSIDLIGFKIFGNTKIDDAFLDAASLSIHAGSVLSHMFYDVIGGKKAMLKQVESYIYEDSMGMSGWIGNKRVLLGNRELMRNHSIDLPPLSKEQKYIKGDKNVMYLSVSGDLAAMFIVEMKANFEVKSYVQDLEKQGVYLMLRTVDSIVTINKLSELFYVSPNIFKILPFRMHESFDNHTGYMAKQSGSLSFGGRFVSFAAGLIACKRTRKVVMLGAAVQTASVILGLILVSVLTLMSSPTQFTAAIMLVYNLAWMVLVLLIQGVRKL